MVLLSEGRSSSSGLPHSRGDTVGVVGAQGSGSQLIDATGLGIVVDRPDHRRESCIAQLGSIGFTFGGTFAGHGVYAVDGPARFVLKDFMVE